MKHILFSILFFAVSSSAFSQAPVCSTKIRATVTVAGQSFSKEKYTMSEVSKTNMECRSTTSADVKLDTITFAVTNIDPNKNYQKFDHQIYEMRLNRNLTAWEKVRVIASCPRGEFRVSEVTSRGFQPNNGTATSLVKTFSVDRNVLFVTCRHIVPNGELFVWTPRSNYLYPDHSRSFWTFAQAMEEDPWKVEEYREICQMSCTINCSFSRNFSSCFNGCLDEDPVRCRAR